MPAAGPDPKSPIPHDVEKRTPPTDSQPAAVPEGDIEIESGVNSTLVADVGWEKNFIQWKRDRSRPTQRWQLNRTPDDLYSVRHSDGNVLAARGEWEVALEPPEPGKLTQTWNVSPVTVYRIANRGDSQSRLVSAVPENNENYPRVVLFEDRDQTNQQWLLISAPAGEESESPPTGDVNIQNVGVYRERVLDVREDGKITYSTKGQNNAGHRWRLTPVASGEDFYHIRHSDGGVLAFGRWDLGMETLDTTKVNQQWSVRPTVLYRLTNQQTGLDLSVDTERPFDGERIVQYRYERRPNQHWKLQTVS